MLIDPYAARRFITGYTSLLLAIGKQIGVSDEHEGLAKLGVMRAYLYANPDALELAIAALAAQGKALEPDVAHAMRTLRIDHWVYLRSTPKHAIFIDKASENAYAVLALNDPLASIVGKGSAMIQAGLCEFEGHYVFDGLVTQIVHLGAGYRRSYTDALAAIKRRGAFHTQCERVESQPENQS
jgi:hypothetical protein